MKKGAVISKCGKYRYTLSRSWDSFLPLNLLFVMLNPSTADAEKDDATIRRLIGFAKEWGYGGFDVVNLFAYRTPNPDRLRYEGRMKSRIDIEGPKNFVYAHALAGSADKIICGWGTNGKLFKQSDRVISTGFLADSPKLYHLGLTITGEPKHPLYLQRHLKPILWEEKSL